MLLICAYTSNLGAEEDKKDELYKQLDLTLRAADNRDKTVLLGDFNARIGRRSDLWQVIGPQDFGKMNSNGLRLHSLCTEHNSIIPNTILRQQK